MSNIKELIRRLSHYVNIIIGIGIIFFVFSVFLVTVELVYVSMSGVYLNLFFGPILGHFLLGLTGGMGMGFILVGILVDLVLEDTVKKINKEKGGKKRGTEKKT